MEFLWFKFWVIWKPVLDQLEDTERLSLYDAITEYATTGNSVDVIGNANLVWPMIKDQLKRDWEDRANGSKGGRPRKPGFSEKETRVTENQKPGFSVKRKGGRIRSKSNSIELDSIEKSENKRTRAQYVSANPPSEQEVKEYCQGMGFSIDAEDFIDFYTTNGWKVGKNPMKDWRAAVRRWARNGITKPQGKPIAQLDYQQREYKEEPAGKLPAWLREMMDEEANAPDTNTAG